MFAIETKNLTKTYGNKVALQNLCLAIEEGKIVGLLGPNGSGKSTFFKCLTGLLTFDGAIKIHGQDVGDKTKSMVSYLPERTYLDMSMTAKEVFDEIIKDRHYYEISGGGVTFSGGECGLPSEFTAAVLKKCKQEKIHTAIESALLVRWENIEAVLPFTDLVFADLKLADPEKHKKYTGADNARIVENLLMLSRRFDNVIVRIPVIPGVNDEKDDLEGFARIIAMLGDGVKEIELLKYNNLAGSKYDFVGRRYTEFSERSQSDDRMRELCAILSEKSGRNCKF